MQRRRGANGVVWCALRVFGGYLGPPLPVGVHLVPDRSGVGPAADGGGEVEEVAVSLVESGAQLSVLGAEAAEFFDGEFAGAGVGVFEAFVAAGDEEAFAWPVGVFVPVAWVVLHWVSLGRQMVIFVFPQASERDRSDFHL
ncbi:hypothetical protein [Nonomuraea wenchangensis]|uniref:hypothetical protein n=1 Tax=Nonomuraea wenchangensis TaxID=568860 RepID=UPI001160CAA7|nr:hypothetical protein [Nonomuraea wenchangensis]